MVLSNRPAKVIANAFSAGFHLMTQRARPPPVGSREIYETSKDLSTSVVPVFFEATGEIRFFDRSVLEDVVAPAS